MEKTSEGHVSERFERLLELYRKPDGWKWGGWDLERATSGAVTRSYVSNLRRGRIEHPGLDKLGALAKAMGFPPGLWFADEDADDGALPAVLRDPRIRSVAEEMLRLGPWDRELLLRVARGIPSSDDGEA